MNWIKRNWFILLPTVLVIALYGGKIYTILKSAFGIGVTLSSTLEDGVATLTGTAIKNDQNDILTGYSDLVKNTPVVDTNLRKDSTYYKNLAKTLYDGMQSYTPSSFSVSNSTMAELETLTKDELLQVYKDFGIKENKAFIFWSQGSGDLIFWLKHELESSWFGDYDRMAKIWAKTGKW